MDLKTAIGAAEHARAHGYDSYYARVLVALLGEIERLRAEDMAHRRDDPRIAAADSSTLGGAA